MNNKCLCGIYVMLLGQWKKKHVTPEFFLCYEYKHDS